MEVDAWLAELVSRAALSCGCDAFDPEIRPSDSKFGDFQANGILQYAKKCGQNPRALAEKIVSFLLMECEIEQNVAISTAGPGFINFRFGNKFLCKWLNEHSDVDSFRPTITSLAGKTVVVDYSSPNAAKRMHVGHLRSMNIGESICRLLEFCGANVIRDNHIGDWGTQFGILIMAIKRENVNLDALPIDTALPTVEHLYKLGNSLVKENESHLLCARKELLKLQNGDAENVKIWGKINAISYAEFERIYAEFGVKFDYVLGESFYRDGVDAVCKSLEKYGIARLDNGALVVFFDEHARFKDQPFLIRKSDGTSNYATTDLATVEYRVERFHADEIVYITDGRQQDHFQQLFMTINRWFKSRGLSVPRLHHVWFGTILGEDGKAIKTRDGSPIYLQDLMNEAKKRAHRIVSEKNLSLSEEEKNGIASLVGLNSIRYFDLAQNRTNDYMFSWENMLSFDGNTAVYLLYAIARIHSILDRARGRNFVADMLETEEECTLVRKLLYFPMVLKQAITDLRPHYLCTYLYELTGEYSTFYGANRVLIDDTTVKNRRLTLCERTLLVLELGLNLLGMMTLKKM
ncbi:MAG: arginine--tRNA ligase [Puniceicoccales bacterium]|jgi:arginyl-tRNA synthetase|nr:arginine--tRNA ligase [Puniceicoccales bacterium]